MPGVFTARRILDSNGEKNETEEVIQTQEPKITMIENELMKQQTRDAPPTSVRI